MSTEGFTTGMKERIGIIKTKNIKKEGRAGSLFIVAEVDFEPS